jgi:hypothetical protein
VLSGLISFLMAFVAIWFQTRFKISFTEQGSLATNHPARIRRFVIEISTKAPGSMLSSVHSG